MKKLITIALALALVFALTACGGKDKPTEEAIPPIQEVPQSEVPVIEKDDEPSGDSAGSVEPALIGWMKSGKYYFDYEMTAEGNGMSSTSTGSMAADGGKFARASIMEIEGHPISSKVIIKDDTTFIVDDINKMIIKQPGVNTGSVVGVVTNYSGMVSINTGTGEVGGKTLPYQEYEAAGAKVKFYLDGDQVYAIVTELGGNTSIMIISNISQNVPADVFEIPEDYAEMAM